MQKKRFPLCIEHCYTLLHHGDLIQILGLLLSEEKFEVAASFFAPAATSPISSSVASFSKFFTSTCPLIAKLTSWLATVLSAALIDYEKANKDQYEL